jgi:lipopolysaccharide export system protein LptA
LRFDRPFQRRAAINAEFRAGCLALSSLRSSRLCVEILVRTFSALPKYGWLLGLTVFALAFQTGFCGEQGIRESSGLKFPEYYDVPYEKQMKSLLEGARVQPQPNGRYICNEIKFQTFLQNGSTQIVVSAPGCFFDSTLHTISSPGPLEMRTADGKFSIAGEGFLLQQTNSNLIISNRVHTIVEAELLGPRAPGDNQPNLTTRQAEAIHIRSEQFDYATNSGLGNYRGNVQVSGTNLSMTSGLLKVVVPMKQAGAMSGLQDITASENVVMEYAGVHATGDQATYSASNGLAHITGKPAWSAAGREGRADELLIDRTNQTFQGIGHAHVKMPGQGLGTASFLPRSSQAATNSAANAFIVIDSDTYELRTNQAVFQKEVRLTEYDGEQVKATMTCGTLTAAFAGTNELQRMVAENHVTMSQEEMGFTAGKAVYTATNGLLELTLDPRWHFGLREGRGDLMLFHVTENEMVVKGNASMRVPANELGEMSGLATDHIKPAAPASSTNQFATILSDEYSLKSDTAQFEGHVRVDHPRMQVTCEQMRVDLPSGSAKPQRMSAERNVVFDLTDNKGQKVRGKGEQALYTYGITATATNDLLELTGDPVLETTNGTFRNKIIILDHASNKIYAPGKYHVRGSVPVTNTNNFRLPAVRIPTRKGTK